MKKINYIITLLIGMTLSACTDTIESILGGGDEMGDVVMFTTYVPEVRQGTRTAKDDWTDEVKSYKAVNQEYEFNVEMFRQGDDAIYGASVYKPARVIQSGHQVFSPDGTLEPKNESTRLFWQDNVNRWGFRATAGTETLEANQRNQDEWLCQDRLLGYSYLPIWTGSDEIGSPTDRFDAINYRTSKEWYADNKKAQELSGLMAENNEDYKKIPLYMQHQRAWVTIILKAGEGVAREALRYTSVNPTVTARLYSYTEDGGGSVTPMEIAGWVKEELIHYDADKNGEAADNVSTTRYDAIVEPYNYAARKDEDVIAKINLSNQNFSFFAGNDLRFISGTEAEKKEAAEDIYNLKPGKHLTITATLSRASRLILITAWIEDWTESVTQTICDDYGQNGDPILIEDRGDLIDFLTDTDKNKAGNVGLIVPNHIDLEDWDGSGYTLNATLNLASAQLTIGNQFVNAISRTGAIINGEFSVKDEFNAPTVIANTNEGIIERVRVTTSGDLSPAKATVAGMVGVNNGSIYQCSSALTVEGTADYVGGIAAKSINGSSGIPTIDGCTVTARVNGSGAAFVAGGGIVGQAEGRVSNNTFEYGITLSQDIRNKNIVGAIGEKNLSTHTNNSWPTFAQYTVGIETIVNNYPGTRYSAVIDNQDELKRLLTSQYNRAELYRVANSFTVNKDTRDSDGNIENWIWGDDVLKNDYFSGTTAEGFAHGEVRFTLNGNDKTITLTGDDYATMLFGNITGEVHNLNLVLDKPIIAARIMGSNNASSDTNTDAIAALAYAVVNTGVIRDVTLKAGVDEHKQPAYIQASTPGGIVVWAKSGAEITNCVSNVPIMMHLDAGAGTDARRYAGGIVAIAHRATITQCKYYGGSGSIMWAGTEQEIAKAKSNNSHYGGIVGGTSEISDTQDIPNLELSDCFSWWVLPTPGQGQTIDAYMGSIIGSTVYHTNNVLVNAMAEGNAGNWWPGSQDDGAGLRVSGMTVEKAIGKKNSITPSKPEGW